MAAERALVRRVLTIVAMPELVAAMAIDGELVEQQIEIDVGRNRREDCDDPLRSSGFAGDPAEQHVRRRLIVAVTVRVRPL